MPRLSSNVHNFPTPSQSQAAKEGAGDVVGNVARGVASAIESSSPIAADEMRKAVLGSIQKLPPLPQTIVEIYAIKQSGCPDIDKLLRIINTDPLLVVNLLKISNSVMYASSRKITTAEEMIQMLGTRMVINVAICAGISGHLKPDLSPYGVEVESYTQASALQSAIIELWPEEEISPMRRDLQFAAFLQEVGTIVISKIAIEKDLVPAFRHALAVCESRSSAEESVFGISSAEVTSLVFAEWKFNQDIIDYISGSDYPERAAHTALTGSQALRIAKTLAPVGSVPMSLDNVEKARARVIEYGFDETAFERMADRMFYRIR